MPLRHATPDQLSSRYDLKVGTPLMVWMLVLALIAVVESGLMLLLPIFLPAGTSRLVEAIVDALMLSMALAPVLWWLLLRPLQQAARLRDQFLADLFQTIENERRSTAHDLHDGVGQQLGLLVTGLKSLKEGQSAEELLRQGRDLRELAQQALRETKRLALGLRPSLLDDLGLAVALERLAEEVARVHGIPIDCQVADLVGVRLPELQETTLFRIVQEALQNIVSHSEASTASIILKWSDRHIRLEVTDDGRGLPLSRELQTSRPGHMGLVGMSERASLAGGTFQLDSTPGGGTRILVHLPSPGGTEHDGEDSSPAGR
ncbi:MAG: sensor histidine kinase [Planctomycetaceae bacterium]|jgi:signal transduction histidine kinase